MSVTANKAHTSSKHEAIDKSNTVAIVAVGIATFLAVFAIFAVKALFSQSQYHIRVIDAKKAALKQLEDNVDQLDKLKVAYDSFASEPANIIGGNSDGDQDRDGNNVKLVLDSLPSEYDLPGLTSSFEKILISGGYEVNKIGGQENKSLKDLTEAVGDAQATSIPFSFSVTASPDNTKNLLSTLEKSIRPMNIRSLRMQINNDQISTLINLETYFAQQRTYELGSKVVK